MAPQFDNDELDHLTKVRQLDTGPYHRPDDFMGGGGSGPVRGPVRKLKASWIVAGIAAGAGAKSDSASSPSKPITPLKNSRNDNTTDKVTEQNVATESSAESVSKNESSSHHLLPRHSYRSTPCAESSAESVAKNLSSSYHPLPKHSYRGSKYEISKDSTIQVSHLNESLHAERGSKHELHKVSTPSESLHSSGGSLESPGGSFHSASVQDDIHQGNESLNNSLHLDSSKNLSGGHSSSYLTQVKAHDVQYNKPGEFMGGGGLGPAVPKRKFKSTPTWLSDSHSSVSSMPSSAKEITAFGEQSLPNLNFDAKHVGKLKSNFGSTVSTTREEKKSSSEDVAKFGEQSLPNLHVGGSSIHVDNVKKDPLSIGLPDSMLESSDSSLDDMDFMEPQQPKSVVAVNPSKFHMYGHGGAPRHPVQKSHGGAPLHHGKGKSITRIASCEVAQVAGLSISLHEPTINRQTERSSTDTIGAVEVSDSYNKYVPSREAGVGRSHSYQHHKLPSLQNTKGIIQPDTSNHIDTVKTDVNADSKSRAYNKPGEFLGGYKEKSTSYKLPGHVSQVIRSDASNNEDTVNPGANTDSRSKAYNKPGEFLGGYKEKSTSYKLPEHVTQVRQSQGSGRRLDDFIGGGSISPMNPSRGAGVRRSHSYQHHKRPSLQKEEGNIQPDTSKHEDTVKIDVNTESKSRAYNKPGEFLGGYKEKSTYYKPPEHGTEVIQSDTSNNEDTVKTGENTDSKSKAYNKPDEFLGGYKEKSTSYKLPEHVTQVRQSHGSGRRPDDFMGGGSFSPMNAPRRKTIDPSTLFGKK